MEEGKFLLGEILKFIIIISFLFVNDGLTKDQTSLNEISSYLDSFLTMDAEFTQINSDGEEKTGTIKIKRPGKLRIEYDDPSSILIVCDGSKLAVINKKQKNISLYKKDQLPIGMFLNDDFSIKNYNILNFSSKDNVIKLTISKPGSENMQKIVFFFEKNPMLLRKWVIIEKNNSKTEMYLSKLLINQTIEKKEFVISDPRMLPFGRVE